MLRGLWGTVSRLRSKESGEQIAIKIWTWFSTVVDQVHENRLVPKILCWVEEMHQYAIQKVNRIYSVLNVYSIVYSKMSRSYLTHFVPILNTRPLQFFQISRYISSRLFISYFSQSKNIWCLLFIPDFWFRHQVDCQSFLDSAQNVSLKSWDLDIDSQALILGGVIVHPARRLRYR